MRNSAPQFSVILIDEPELHLNPRLIRGLPQFYSQHLGSALDNQIWLITHSDALLREAVGDEKFNVFHMQPCSLTLPNGNVVSKKNQLKPLGPGSDLDLAVADLVGDLAAYQPDRRVIIFEGGGDTDFDKWMTATLFPKFAQGVNLISGSNKAKVSALHEILDRAYEKGEINTKFYGVVDADYDKSERTSKVRLFSWPVYHIENFLIDIPIIARVVSHLYPNPIEAATLTAELRECARKCMPKAIRHSVVTYVSKHLTTAIDLSYDPAVEDVAGAVHSAAVRSVDRSGALMNEALSLDAIQKIEEETRASINAALADGSWVQKIPGRDILKAYSNLLPNGIGHGTLRTMIVNRMAEEGYQPPLMAEVIKEIESAS